MIQKLSLVIIVSWILVGNTYSQTVLLKQTVPEDFAEVDDNFGPNRRFFNFPFVGIGWHISDLSHQQDTFISPAYFKSFDAKFGTREKLKINRFFALGTDFEISASSHVMNIRDKYIQTIVSTNTTKAKYMLYKLGGSAYYQINFKPNRGNQLGAYLDIGAYGNFIFGKKLVEKFKNKGNKESTKYVQKNLQSLKNNDYGILLRYGRNVFAIYAKYRYSNTFKKSPYINLPRLTIGFEYFPGNV